MIAITAFTPSANSTARILPTSMTTALISPFKHVLTLEDFAISCSRILRGIVFGGLVCIEVYFMALHFPIWLKIIEGLLVVFDEMHRVFLASRTSKTQDFLLCHRRRLSTGL